MWHEQVNVNTNQPCGVLKTSLDCVGTISFIKHIAVLSSNFGGDELVLKVPGYGQVRNCRVWEANRQFLTNRGDDGERLLQHEMSNEGLHATCQFEVASSAFW